MKKFLLEIHQVPDNILDEYLSYWQEYTVPKKTVLSEKDKTESYLYFVQEGIQKAYFLNDEKQHILFFSYAPSFSGLMESFLTQNPSKYHLETITSSRFLRISYKNHEKQIRKHRELETLFRIFIEKILVGLMERHHQLLAHNIETRFKTFAKRSPHLFQLVAQKDIASYLRIDATNFSKLYNSVQI
ncbi:Crp/Fnr family transcriptional regulator [Tenacibaculum sp. Bg11-29]|uniref:Crp/Fnr family transcriptional regulator n=1 Tax=Tenacibaculum sp. Bg11-29 TaxID=2058306 RepID=UPI000C346E62|nr:cyclic nucleotide-binding domain-containing protein [Tenacibaculum sp. Bg11-29]PKH52058.1 Crp/Fnr family transcriptional regulator [Tenacibaculum sp. Bg11-29]